MTLRSSGGMLRAPAASRRLLALVSAAILAVGFVAPAAAAKPTTVGTVSRGHARLVGTTSLSVRHAKASSSVIGLDTAGEFQPDPEAAASDPQISGARSVAHVPSKNVPRPATSAVTTGDATGFDGLNHFDNRYAGAGSLFNTQFSLEPPDQALCVSGSQIVESVNTVLRVREKDGTVLTSGNGLTTGMPINEFFGLAPEIIRTDAPNYVYGDFTSDPKCYFDTESQRWFLTILQADVNPSNGAFTGATSVMIAVSQTADATGTWNLYTIDTTNDDPGFAAAHGDCPCLGDQPLIGADANGFYVTTNVFPLFGDGFNGAMVYAISKADLASGAASAAMQRVAVPDLAEGYAYSIQPTTTPPGEAFASEQGGTEYFLSALDFNGVTDNRVAAWALTNTSSLDTTPDVAIHVAVIGSERYGQPPAVVQKKGSTPFLDLLGQPAEHLSMLNSNDDRMNQTVYVNGQIWGALNTAVNSRTGATRTGIAYFMVTPHWSADGLTASMTRQGYISVAGNNSVMFPAIAANADGDGVIGFTLAGTDYFPSAAYVTLNAADGAGAVKIAAAGQGPADGFTGYPLVAGGNGVERWGDYSAAVADSEGNLWFATEYIGQSCTASEFAADPTCGFTRSLYANWGTWIAKISS